MIHDWRLNVIKATATTAYRLFDIKHTQILKYNIHLTRYFNIYSWYLFGLSHNFHHIEVGIICWCCGSLWMDELKKWRGHDLRVGVLSAFKFNQWGIVFRTPLVIIQIRIRRKNEFHLPLLKIVIRTTGLLWLWK